MFVVCSSSIPLHTISLARIVIFMIAILAHGRQVEWTARLDFLWQLQASHEKREMAVLQESNKHILYNLLPAHVAAHFLDNQFRNNMVNKLATKKHTFCILTQKNTYTPQKRKIARLFVLFFLLVSSELRFTATKWKIFLAYTKEFFFIEQQNPPR